MRGRQVQRARVLPGWVQVVVLVTFHRCLCCRLVAVVRGRLGGGSRWQCCWAWGYRVVSGRWGWQDRGGQCVHCRHARAVCGQLLLVGQVVRRHRFRLQVVVMQEGSVGGLRRCHVLSQGPRVDFGQWVHIVLCGRRAICVLRYFDWSG